MEEEDDNKEDGRGRPKELKEDCNRTRCTGPPISLKGIPFLVGYASLKLRFRTGQPHCILEQARRQQDFLFFGTKLHESFFGPVQKSRLLPFSLNNSRQFEICVSTILHNESHRASLFYFFPQGLVESIHRFESDRKSCQLSRDGYDYTLQFTCIPPLISSTLPIKRWFTLYKESDSLLLKVPFRPSIPMHPNQQEYKMTAPVFVFFSPQAKK